MKKCRIGIALCFYGRIEERRNLKGSCRRSLAGIVLRVSLMGFVAPAYSFFTDSKIDFKGKQIFSLGGFYAYS